MKPVPISEAQWQEQVVTLATALGWQWMHCRRSIGKHGRWVTATNVPWPDLTLWSERQGRLLLAELKTDTGKVSPGQHATLTSLAHADIEVHLWRPSDLDAVHRTLAGSRTAPTRWGQLIATEATA